VRKKFLRVESDLCSRSLASPELRKKVAASVVAGIAVGAALALVVGGALISVEGVVTGTKANGWVAFPECGHSGIDILEQATCAATLPAANVPQEAVYWQPAAG
jgi:hypothetical protein